MSSFKCKKVYSSGGGGSDFYGFLQAGLAGAFGLALGWAKAREGREESKDKLEFDLIATTLKSCQKRNVRFHQELMEAREKIVLSEFQLKGLDEKLKEMEKELLVSKKEIESLKRELKSVKKTKKNDES